MEAMMHIGSLLLIVWLVIGGIAAGQRLVTGEARKAREAKGGPEGPGGPGASRGDRMTPSYPCPREAAGA